MFQSVLYSHTGESSISNMDIDDLCMTCQDGDNDTVEKIMFRGDVDVNSTDVFGHYPLYYAMHFNNPSILRTLLANVNTRLGVTHCNYDDNRIGMLECCYWHVECVKIFTSHSRCNTNVLNRKNEDGDTILMIAAIYGNLNLVRVLAQLPGIDFDAKNKKEETALDLARQFNAPGIVECLEENYKNEVTATTLMRLSEIQNIATGIALQKANKPKREKIYWNCNSAPSSSKKLFICAGCRVARYCGEMCQEEDRDRHEDWCEKRERRRKEKYGQDFK